MKSINQPRRTVGQTALALPVLGFGGASVGNLYRASDDATAEAAMAAALDCGIDYFDTAPHYGHGLSEVRMGRFFDGTRPDGVVLSTKVGRVLEPSGPAGPPDHGFVDPLPFTQRFDYSYDGVMRSFAESRERLRHTPVDILYLHDIGRLTHGDGDHPALFAEAMDGGMKALHELKAAGDVKAVGLGVNEWQVCREALDHADIDVFMLAGRYTLLEQEPAQELFDQCLARGTSVVCAAPFNSGLLARRPDASSHYNYETAPPEIVERARELFDRVEKAGGVVQAAALQFPLRHPAVVSVVSGMSSAARVLQTVDWFETPIPESVWAELGLANDAAGQEHR